MNDEPHFGSDMPLDEAKQLMRKHVESGFHCPLCKQFVKMYRRKLTGTSAAQLIQWWRTHGKDWCKPVEQFGPGGDLIKARYWNLIEGEDGQRADGSWRNGWWRITPKGEHWIRGEVNAMIQKYVYLYDGEALAFEGGLVSIDDTLGTKFNYGELMGGT